VRAESGAAVPDVGLDGSSGALSDVLDRVLPFPVVDVRDGLAERPALVVGEFVGDVRLVEVHVAVDEPGREEAAVGVEFACCVGTRAVEGGDSVSVDCDVRGSAVG